MHHNARVATVAGVGALVLWSTTVAVARRLSEQVGPVTAATAVYSVSGILALAALLPGGLQRQRWSWGSAGHLAGCGSLFVGYMLVLFLAIGRAASRQQVLEIGLLNYLWPALTLLLSLVLLGTKASWLLLPGTLLALAGVVLVVTHEAAVSWRSVYDNLAGNPAAYGLAFTAAVFWALYSNLTRKWMGVQDRGGVLIFLPVTAGVLFLIGCVVDEPRVWTHRSVAEAGFLGVATFSAYRLWEHAMRKGNIVTVVAASYLTPLLSTLVSCFYLAVVPGTRLWVGCGVLILGSLLSWRACTSNSQYGSIRC